jgi:hypothetical protein
LDRQNAAIGCVRQLLHVERRRPSPRSLGAATSLEPEGHAVGAAAGVDHGELEETAARGRQLHLAAREVDEVPRPVSELVTPRVRAKRRMAKLLRSGPLLPDRFEEPGGPSLLTRPIFFVRERRLEQPYLKLVFENERRFVYRYDPP